MSDHPDLLVRIDGYLDAVPRTAARTEEIGPFTLFVNDGPGWQYYARPTPGSWAFAAADVRAVRERQRALGQPEALEWVVNLSPSVGPAAAAAGLRVAEHPLMHLPREDFRPVPVPPGASIALASPQHDVATLHAVAALAFGAPGTEVGQAGPSELLAAAAEVDDDLVTFTRERMERGLTVTAVATVDGHAVAVGSHNPIADATEIVGVATLPACRRRGLGAAVTAALIEDALARGADLILLSAGDGVIARVYARLGFRIVGAVGAAAGEGPDPEHRRPQDR